MKKVQEISYHLSQGNVDEAAAIRLSAHFDDPSLELEIIEIAEQALIGYLKSGQVDKACKTSRLFAISEDVAQDAIKQAVLSIYCEGDLSMLLHIKNSVPMSREMREEIIAYCESWGRHAEAEAMRHVFLGQ
jgi:hypothetical protein